MQQDIRWKQRFQNFERSFLFLSKNCQLEVYDELQGTGLVQSFEFTFELAWKTLKDYLQNQGLEFQFPREVIKQAFAAHLIEDRALWIEMLNKRNELTHQEQAKKAIERIRNHYLQPLAQVYQAMKTQCLA